MFADDINLSDAILLALSSARWIGPLRLRTDPPVKRKRRTPAPRTKHPKPANIVPPAGVVWNAYNRQWSAQLPDHRAGPLWLGNTPPTQAGADLAGRMLAAARAARVAGGDHAAIKAAARAVKETGL